MATARPELEIAQPAPVPRLLVELPSWPRTFVANLRDLVAPARLPELELRSAPAAFWPDVFVTRRLPWSRFVQSGIFHVIAFALLIALSRLIAMQPAVVATPAFDHTEVVYYQPSEYLPPLDTRREDAAEAKKTDPEFARQPIISVPPEADNRSQTIVAPPNVRLKRDVAVPNIVAWSDRMEKPRLYIPPVPVTPAAEITRLAPQMANSVVAPPPDATHLTHRRDSLTLQSAVVAPPPDLQTARSAPMLNAPQPALISPPPNVENSSMRALGDLNIGRSAVINPAPQLAVSERRTVPGGRSSAISGMAPQVVAPPPSVSSGASGSPGRVIALSLHPAVGAPPTPPAGNRRGAFAATPEGRAGASGSPGSSNGDGNGANHGAGNDKGVGSSGKGKADLPAGLYVGSAGAVKTSPVAGDPAPASATQLKTNLTASVHPPRVSTTPATPSGNSAKLSEAERAVFGDRKFYSMTLNMPNLNSAGGSWIVHFTEQKPDFDPHHADAAAAELSQPAATRKVDPAYPLQLMRENVSGTVILYAVIHADGTVANVRVLRGVDDRLDRFASEAVAQWKFVPAKRNGSPVDVEATFQIPFKPSRVGTNF